MYAMTSHMSLKFYKHLSGDKDTYPNTYRLAIPAFLTAVEMALIAVHMELRRVVSSPVPLAFLPSSKTNLVRVTTLVSNAPLSDMMTDCLSLKPSLNSCRFVPETMY